MKIIDTLSLFQDLNQELVYFMAELSQEEWLLQTTIPDRSVKDLAAHILDGSLRRLSLQRDHFSIDSKVEISSNDDFIHYIQELNQSWMIAFKRLSPRLLIEMLKKYEQEVYELFSRLKSDDIAQFPVSWAGETQSENWFDIAREYTEKWHHQMQMRMACNRPLLLSERFLEPVYETFMLGMPHHLQQSNAQQFGNNLLVEFTGEVRLKFSFVYDDGIWKMSENHLQINEARSYCVVPSTLGWQLFTNTIRNKTDYFHQIRFEGNRKLAESAINLVTVLS